MKELFKVNIWVSELIDGNFRDIFGRMEAKTNLDALVPTFEKFLEHLKKYIEDNEK